MLKGKDQTLILEGAYGTIVNKMSDGVRLPEERVFGGSRAQGIDPALMYSSE